VNDCTKRFIEQSNQVHENKYTYPNTLYLNRNSKVTINCLIHGEFSQHAGSHLSGSGCKHCYYARTVKRLTKSNDQWVQTFRLIHGDTYQYTFTEDTPTFVTLYCLKHNTSQVCYKSNISNGHGPMCCRSAQFRTQYQKSLETFVLQANTIHHNKYEYNHVKYVNTHTKIPIFCSIHGTFDQTPLNHLQGAGCPNCAKIQKAQFSVGGFTHRRFSTYPELKNTPALLYLITGFNEIETFIKIGITTKTVDDRLKFSSVFPYEYHIIGTRSGSLFDVFCIEQQIKRALKKFKYKPTIMFGGYTECFVVEAKEQLSKLTNINIL